MPTSKYMREIRADVFRTLFESRTRVLVHDDNGVFAPTLFWLDRDGDLWSENPELGRFPREGSTLNGICFHLVDQEDMGMAIALSKAYGDDLHEEYEDACRKYRETQERLERERYSPTTNREKVAAPVSKDEILLGHVDEIGNVSWCLHVEKADYRDDFLEEGEAYWNWSAYEGDSAGYLTATDEGYWQAPEADAREAADVILDAVPWRAGVLDAMDRGLVEELSLDELDNAVRDWDTVPDGHVHAPVPADSLYDGINEAPVEDVESRQEALREAAEAWDNAGREEVPEYYTERADAYFSFPEAKEEQTAPAETRRYRGHEYRLVSSFNGVNTIWTVELPGKDGHFEEVKGFLCFSEEAARGQAEGMIDEEIKTQEKAGGRVPTGVRIVVLDTETTGLDPKTDEILQISMVDGEGNVLLNTYVHPEQHDEWPKAQEINSISPDMVDNAPTVADIAEQVEDILMGADIIIGYNIGFDMGFIEREFQVLPGAEVIDVMKEFAPVLGKWNRRRGDFTWPKLSECANHYGIEFRAHDSLEDTKATLACYEAMLADPEYQDKEGLELKRAKNLINDFCREEYMDEADFSDLERVGLCYTTLGEDEEHEIQVYADLLRRSIKTEIDGVPVEEIRYTSLREMCDTELKWLDFQSLVRVDGAMRETYEELTGKRLVLFADEEEEELEAPVVEAQKLEEPVFEQMFGTGAVQMKEEEAEEEKIYLCITDSYGYEEHIVLNEADLTAKVGEWRAAGFLNDDMVERIESLEVDEIYDFSLGRADKTFWMRAVAPDDVKDVQAFVEGFYSNATEPDCIESRLEENSEYDPNEMFYFSEQHSSEDAVRRLKRLGVDFNPERKSTAELLGVVDRIAEKLGWNVEWGKYSSGSYYAEFYRHSPAGEDFSFSVPFDNEEDLVREVREYVEDFDVDEHVELWIESRGKRGVPESIEVLVDDAKAIQEMCRELGKALAHRDDGILNNGITFVAVEEPEDARRCESCHGEEAAFTVNADGWRRGDHGINFDLCEECAADAVLENDDARVVGSWTGYPAPLPKGPRSAEEVLAGMFELSAGATAEDFSGKKMSYATMYRGTEEWQIIKTEANGTESYRVMPGEAVLDTFEEAKRYVYGLACQEAPLTQQFGCKVARELDAFLDEFEVNHEFSKDGINVADFEYMHQWLTERLLDDMTPEEACHAAFLLDRIEERSRLRGLEETIRRNWQAAESIHAANETFTAAYAYSRETIAQKIRTSLKPITSASLRELLRLMPMDSFSQGICRTVAPVKATCARV